MQSDICTKIAFSANYFANINHFINNSAQHYQ